MAIRLPTTRAHVARGILALLLLSMTASVARAQSGGGNGARLDRRTHTAWATGIVPLAKKGAEGAAKTAALSLARRNLRNFLASLRDDESYVLPAEGDAAELNALVGSARIASAGKAPGARYQVALTLKLPRRIGDAPTAAPAAKEYTEPDPAQVRTFPAPGPTGEEALLTPPDQTGPFTGLIIDTRGLNVKASMSPRVMDAAFREVYSGQHASVEFLEDVGVVGYAGSIAIAQRQPRCGNRPLVVRAIGVADAFACWPVLSLSDARRFLTDRGASGIIRNCAVTFITDERARMAR